jgi:hypothetical protein
MTEIEGSLKQIGQGKTQKTFNYEPLDSLVDIVFNSAGKLSAVFSADHRLTSPQARSSRRLCRRTRTAEVEVEVVRLLRRRPRPCRFPCPSALLRAHLRQRRFKFSRSNN